MQEQILFLGSVLLFSYPFWTEALLGNVEVWVFVVVAAAILLYLRGHSYLAGILFGIAAAMKIFPVIYLGLFLPRRQYKQIALALVAAVTINVIGLWAVCPDIRLSAHGIAAGIAENRAHYMLHYLPAETGIDHSIFGFLKVCYMGVKHRVIISSWLLTAYMAFIALGGVALYFLKIWKLPLMNQVVVLCILSVLLPPTSHDYTLMHLYIPWGLLILYLLQYREWNAHALWFTAVFVCFALLFSPQAELIYRAKQFSGEIKCVVLILLLFLVLRKPLSKPLLEQKQDVPA